MTTQLTERQQWHMRGIDLYRHAREGSRRAQAKLAESVAAGELPIQIAPLVRRQLRAYYEQITPLSSAFTTRTLVQSINVDEQYNIFSVGDQSNIPLLDNGDTFTPGGLPTIGARESYPEIGLAASGKTVRARKIGEAFGIDWESIVRLNGTNVNIIDEAIQAFGRHAANQEDIDIARLFVSGSGITTGGTLLTNALQVSGNPDLTSPVTLQNGVQAALNRTQTVQSGTTQSTVQVGYSKYALVTSFAYAPYAKQALNTKSVTNIPERTGTPSASRGVQYETALDFGADVEVYGWKWLSRIYPSIGSAWFLVPIATADDLPVICSNYLDGAEKPSFFVKDANSTGYTGGDTPYTDGDFDSDSVVTKVRHVHGSNAMWSEAIVWSSGANS